MYFGNEEEEPRLVMKKNSGDLKKCGGKYWRGYVLTDKMKILETNIYLLTVYYSIFYHKQKYSIKLKSLT
jgi:hypothetical protein